MKTLTKFFTLFLALSFLAACNSGPEGEKANTTDAEAVSEVTGDAETYTIGEGSLVNWQGTKPTGAHDGLLTIKEGSIQMNGDKVQGGSFVIDMGSLVTTDPLGDKKEALEGHLKGEDFFDVAKYPTASFAITSAEAMPDDNSATHLVKGNLTMKGVTKNVEFKAIVSMKDGKLQATTPKFVIDRTEWNVKYGSQKFTDKVLDSAINDNIGLSISLNATKS